MLSLYIHIPYCVSKCPYCGFYSTVYSSSHAAKFITALRKEALDCSRSYGDKIFNSVYIGGGTPSVLSDEEFAHVLSIVKTFFPISRDAEFTAEANPHTAVNRDLSLWREGGVNRLSLGVQSFSDAVLHNLGRLHTAEDAERAFRRAKNAGFQNVGMDLMYGIPYQTSEQWRETLDRAIALMPEHLSIYALSLDEGSAFRQETESGKRPMPDDDLAANMYEFALSMLACAGYGRYEISNFSLPRYECRHNMNYWQRGEYLGLGPGAWSFLGGTRSSNIADVNRYITNLALGIPVIAESESLGIEQSSRETILLSLRTAKGLDLCQYLAEYGPHFLQHLEAAMLPLAAAGLLQVNEGVLTLTDRGILLSNEVLSRLSP
jgi:oxygen-independent coproporphyrinogen-3 oxidase